MNDDNNWRNRPENEDGQGHEQEPRSSIGITEENVGLAAGNSRDEGAGRVDSPSYAYAPGTSAVIHKATSIAVALNHAEITVAHLIAAIMLTPGAVDPFNEGRLNRALAPLNTEIALEAALKLLLQNIKSHTGEQTETPLRSRELNDLFRRAAKFVLERAPEHRQIEVSDILRVIAEEEPAENFRHLITGKSVPSLGDLTEAVDGIKQATFTGMTAVKFSAEELRRSLESHVKEFKDVVCVPEENRPAPSSVFPRPDGALGLELAGPPIQNTVLRLRDVVAAVDKNRSTTDMRLSALTSSVDKLGLVTASTATELGTMQAEAARLQHACFKALAFTRLFAIVAVSALVATAVIGLVAGYKVWNL